jgi:hypothetical protein
VQTKQRKAKDLSRLKASGELAHSLGSVVQSPGCEVVVFFLSFVDLKGTGETFYVLFFYDM